MASNGFTVLHFPQEHDGNEASFLNANIYASVTGALWSSHGRETHTYACGFYKRDTDIFVVEGKAKPQIDLVRCGISTF